VRSCSLIGKGLLGNLAVGATYGSLAAPTSGAIIEGNLGIETTRLLRLDDGAYCDGREGWLAGSDKAYKKDIDYNFKYGLKTVEQLKPVYYVHKDDKSNKKQIGFVAQDIKKAVPELISGEEGSYMLNYGQLTAVLVNAIKEQQKEIEILKAEIKNLKKK